MRTFLVWLALLLSAPLHAAQDPIPVTQAVEQYLANQTATLAGEVSIEVRGLDRNNALRPCAGGQFEVEMPSGARRMGRTHVAVQCAEPGGWRVIIPVRIRVVTDYLVAARPIGAGQAIGEADIGRQRGDLSELPAGVLTDPAQIRDRTAAQAIPAGRPLRQDMLRMAMVIRQGQSVKVISRGPGFQVANEGKALNNAFEGQVAQVRLASGQVISGIARGDGQVEVSH